MFYSHEILTSRQYGVATVWLVATIGPRSTLRRVTRKAILGVDVAKACDTIENPPGAPIALRLQANLLYGVTRVYQQQCGYVLTDAEKIQDHMRRFYNAVASGSLDAAAGKAKRHHLILVDDPDFDLSSQLPPFDFDMLEADLLHAESQASRKTSSQLSPVDRASSSSSRGGSFLGGLEIPRSSSLSSLGVQNPFEHESLSAQKHQGPMMPFEDDDELAIGEFGLSVDADGNVMGESELPAFPPQHQAQDGGDLGMMFAEPDQVAPVLDGDGDVHMIHGEQPLSDGQAPHSDQPAVPDDHVSSDQAVAAALRARRQKRPKLLAPDEETRIGRQEFKSWGENYLENMERGRRTRHTIPIRQARQNAYLLTFGRGIANIGQPLGIPGFVHPLAQEFAGRALEQAILGFVIEPEEPGSPPSRRRSSAEAFGDDEEDQRRVRLRLELEDQAGRGTDAQEDLPQFLGQDEPEVEVGREPGSALSDQPSAPWNRHSSLVPSSTRASAQKIGGSRVDVSPLVGRGSVLHDIERMSDNAPHFSSDGFQPEYAQDHASSEDNPVVIGEDMQEADTSQALRDALDRDGRNFLGFVEQAIGEKGDIEADEKGRQWLSFEDMFMPKDTTRVVAAQAFYHILSLATKGALAVHQEGDGNVPFGKITVGVDMRLGDQKDQDDGIVAGEEVADGAE